MDPLGSRGVLGVIEECFSAEEQEEADEGITVTRNQLQEKVVEMENFAGHLEEIFLTVEVRSIHFLLPRYGLLTGGAQVLPDHCKM
jgi:hypothetical protein